MLVNGYLEGDNIYSTVCDDRMAVHKATGQLHRLRMSKDCLPLYEQFLQWNEQDEGATRCTHRTRSSRSTGIIRQCAKDVISARDLLLELAGRDWSSTPS